MPIDPLPIRLLKRAALLVIGPLQFLYVAFVPLLYRHHKGFHGWYWNSVKRACSRLLWLLSIRAEMPEAQRQELVEDTNSIFVANHCSHLDGFALMDIIPDEKWFTFAAKKELCDVPILRIGFKAGRIVEIDRKSGSTAIEALTEAIATLPVRRSVLLFAEGTRSKTDTLGEFKPGAILMARATGRHIRPLVIKGSQKLLPPGKLIPASGTIQVQSLPPFHCDPDATVEEDLARLRALMLKTFEA